MNSAMPLRCRSPAIRGNAVVADEYRSFTAPASRTTDGRQAAFVSPHHIPYLALDLYAIALPSGPVTSAARRLGHRSVAVGTGPTPTLGWLRTEAHQSTPSLLGFGSRDEAAANQVCGFSTHPIAISLPTTLPDAAPSLQREDEIGGPL